MKTNEVRRLILEFLSKHLKTAGWKCVKSKELFRKEDGEFELFYFVRVFTGSPGFESIRVETSFAINHQVVRSLLSEVVEGERAFKGQDFRYSISTEYGGRGRYRVVDAIQKGVSPLDYLQSGVLSDFQEIVVPILAGLKTVNDLEGFVNEMDWDDGVFKHITVRRALANVALSYLANSGNFIKVADGAYGEFVERGAMEDAEVIAELKSYCESK